MPFFGKGKKAKAAAAAKRGGGGGGAPPSAPGFHKCYFLGSTPVIEPTRDASEKAFATIVKSVIQDHPRCIVRATVNGVAAKSYPDRTQLFDVAIYDIRVLTVVGRAVVVVSKDAGGPDSPHTAYSFLTAHETEAKLVASRLAQICKTINAVLNEIAAKSSKPGPGAAAAAPPPKASPAKSKSAPKVPPAEEETTLDLSPVPAQVRGSGSQAVITTPQTYDTASAAEATIDLSSEPAMYDTATSALSVQPSAISSSGGQVYEAASATRLESDHDTAPAPSSYPSVEQNAEFVDEPDTEGYLSMMETEATHFESSPDYITLKMSRGGSTNTLGSSPSSPASSPPALETIVQSVPLYVDPGELIALPPMKAPKGQNYAAMAAGAEAPSLDFIRQMTLKARRTRDGSLMFAS